MPRVRIVRSVRTTTLRTRPTYTSTGKNDPVVPLPGLFLSFRCASLHREVHGPEGERHGAEDRRHQTVAVLAVFRERHDAQDAGRGPQEERHPVARKVERA